MWSGAQYTAVGGGGGEEDDQSCNILYILIYKGTWVALFEPFLSYSDPRNTDLFLASNNDREPNWINIAMEALDYMTVLLGSEEKVVFDCSACTSRPNFLQSELVTVNITDGKFDIMLM